MIVFEVILFLHLKIEKHMQRQLFILIAFLIGNYAIAGIPTPGSPDHVSTKLVYGKVIDKVSGEEIAGAEIQIGEKKVYSDLEGNFSALVPADKATLQLEAAVNYISYNETCITIDLFSYTPLVIEIVAK